MSGSGQSDDVMDLVPIQSEGPGDMRVEVSRWSGFLDEEEPGDRYLGGCEPLRGVRSFRERVCHENRSKLRRDLGIYLHLRHRWRGRFSEK